MYEFHDNENCKNLFNSALGPLVGILISKSNPSDKEIIEAVKLFISWDPESTFESDIDLLRKAFDFMLKKAQIHFQIATTLATYTNHQYFLTLATFNFVTPFLTPAMVDKSTVYVEEESFISIL